MTEWYLQSLSPSEIRAHIRYALWREENDELLKKELLFLSDELSTLIDGK